MFHEAFGSFTFHGFLGLLIDERIIERAAWVWQTDRSAAASAVASAIAIASAASAIAGSIQAAGTVARSWSP